MTSHRRPSLLLLLLVLTTITAAANGLPFSLSPQPPPQSLPPTALYEPILNHLGFHTLASAVPSLTDSPSFSAWNGPSTIFAVPDSSLSSSCRSSSSSSLCSVPRILSEHIVPGLFSFSYLLSLPSPSLLPSMSPSLCLLLTNSSSGRGLDGSYYNGSSPVVRLFINGVEITHPDMFDNGIVVVHGIEGFVSHLSPFSCSTNQHGLSASPPGSMTSVSISINGLPNFPLPSAVYSDTPSPVMRLMLRDAMLRLRSSGYAVLALAMKVKYVELASLESMTIFALSDIDIFAGAHKYVGEVRFHVVPNRFLEATDLEDLTVGTVLPTLEKGEYLVVTSAGGRAAVDKVRINYVRIKAPEVVKNQKIVVHLLFLPFPHLHPATVRDLIIGQNTVTDTEVISDAGDSAIVNHTEGMSTARDVYSCTAALADGTHEGNCDLIPPAAEDFHDL